MNTTKNNAIHLTAEAELLVRALGGDRQAINKALKYLGSNNLGLRQILKKAIQELNSLILWRQLLHCLALHQWNDHLDCEWRSDIDASQRIDQSIIDVFMHDDSEDEKNVKEDMLYLALDDRQQEICQVAAYLLSLRGDSEGIPTLGEIIEKGTQTWKLRAIRVLADLKDERCLQVLIKGLLRRDEPEVHKEASRVLHSLGRFAEPAWVELLDHSDSHIRWHAARGLSETGDTRYILMMAEGLLDENHAVRWATADVLASHGKSAVPVILSILSRCKSTESVRRAAYHALNGISSSEVKKRIQPLLDALHDSAADIKSPAVAQQLLFDWEKKQ